MDTHLENTVKLRGKHHVTLRLELPAHKRLLTVKLALRELGERLVGQHDRHVRFALRLALVHGTGRLEVDCPDGLLARRVLDPQLEDGVHLACGSARARPRRGELPS